MIQSVATEYGIANLSGKTLRERAESMIAIAHRISGMSWSSMRKRRSTEK